MIKYLQDSLMDCAGLSLHWSSDCNMKCQYCYIEKRKHEMNQYNLKIQQALADGTFLQNIKNVFGDIKDNIESLSLWGAEPTLNYQYFPAFFPQLLDFFTNANDFMFSTNALAGFDILKEYFYEPILAYCHENKRKLTFNLQFSLDGPQEINDSSRHMGATDNTLDCIYKLIQLFPQEEEYVKLSICTKATLDISYMRAMVEEGPAAMQRYYDFSDAFATKASDLAKGKKNLELNLFLLPTLVDPGTYTVEDGKVFAKWVTLLKSVNRVMWTSHYDGPLFVQPLMALFNYLDVEDNPIGSAANRFSCSAGHNNWTIDYDGTVYTCNRLCKNAALNDAEKYKESMLSNSNIDKLSDKKMLKRVYANRVFHDSLLTRKFIFDSQVFALGKCGLIEERLLTNADLRLVLFYMCQSICCHVGYEEDLTGNKYVMPSSYYKLYGNGAVEAILDYWHYEHQRGYLRGAMQ